MLILKLLIAHFLGDFIFQFDEWVKDKEQKKIKSKFLYLHLAIHTVLLLLMLGFKQEYLGTIAIIVISHGCIDIAKLIIPYKKKRILFFVDQLAHLLVLIGVAWFYQANRFCILSLITTKNLLFVLAVLLVTVVSSVVLRVVFTFWNKELQQIDKSENSLKNAGKYIGILERLFVFIFIAIDHWEAVGFLLAAKSIFRFGDLTKAKDRLLTEYVLIGTLLSFGIAISVGIVYVYLLPNV